MYETCQISFLKGLQMLQDIRTYTYEIIEEQNRTEHKQVPKYVSG